jgi:dihydroceramidase
VGLGSFAFHATLLFEAQLADELPMIYVGSYSAWILYDTMPGWDIWNTRSLINFGALIAFDVLFTWS